MIKALFPTFVAGIIADQHGFPLASHITEKIKMKENELALYAIFNRNSPEKANLTKIKVDLDEAKTIKLVLLLQKTSKNPLRFNTLRKIIQNQVLF